MTELQEHRELLLPKKWVWARIEDICIVKGRVGWKGYKKSDLRSSGPLVIGATHLSNRWRLDISEPVFISHEKYEESEEIKVSVGDLIVAQRGSIGKLALIDSCFGEATINPCVLLLKNITINNHFLLYVLASPYFQEHLRKGNKSTTIPMITQQFLKNTQIPIAPVSQQNRIVNKIEELLSFLDAGTESLHKIQAQLKRYRQAVLKYAFEGKLTEEWRRTHKDQTETAQNLLDKITKELKEKEPRENLFRDNLTEAKTLPEKWTWTYLDAITVNHDGKRIPVSREKRKSMKGEYPYYGASGVIDSVNNYLFDGDYLLIGEDGANLLARSTPIAFQAKGKFWVNNHAHVLTPLGEIPISYLEYYVNSIRLEKYVTGTAQPKLTQNAMNKIPVPVAPIREQLKIVEMISQTFSIIDGVWKTLELMIRHSERLRQSILNAAFNGNLVSQDPFDEPAEKLLARIRVEQTNHNKYGTSTQLEMSSYVK